MRGTTCPSEPQSVISPARIHINPLSRQVERSPSTELFALDMSTALSEDLKMHLLYAIL